MRSVASEQLVRHREHLFGSNRFQTHIVAVARRPAMIVGREARRARQRLVQVDRPRREAAVEHGRLRAEQHDGRNGRERRNVSRAAVVRDQQNAEVQQHRKIAHRFGEAGQIDARRAVARALNRLRQFAIRRHTNDGHRIIPADQVPCDCAERRQRPGADRQQTRARAQEHEAPAGDRRMTPKERVASCFELTRPENQRRQPQRRRAHEAFRGWHVRRSDSVGKRDELLRDVLVGIVENGSVHGIATIETLLSESMKTDSDLRAAQSRQNGAHASEQLEVQHRVEPECAHAPHGPDAVSRQCGQRSASDRDHPFRRNLVEQVEHRVVLFGTEQVEGRRRVVSSKSFEHRTRQDERTHLRQHDDQDPLHVARHRFRAAQTMQDRDEPAHGCAEHAIEPALTMDIQRAHSLSGGPTFTMP